MGNTTTIKIIDNELYINLNKLGIFSGLVDTIWTTNELIPDNKTVSIREYLYLIGDVYSLFFKNKFDCNWIMDSRYNEDSRDDTILIKCTRYNDNIINKLYEFETYLNTIDKTEYEKSKIYNYEHMKMLIKPILKEITHDKTTIRN